MSRRIRLLLLTIATITVVAALITWLLDEDPAWLYYPAPGGAVLRCQKDDILEWTWGSGTVPHSGGGMPIFPRRRAVDCVRTYTFRATPPDVDGTWDAWSMPMPDGGLWVWDVWFDPSLQRAVAQATGMRGVLPVDVPLVPNTCSRAERSPRGEIELRNIVTLWTDVPATGSRYAQYDVNAFGAVEPGANGSVIRQEWSPDIDGCFTRWWESDELPRPFAGRYALPWEFDRIDRRTSVFVEQLQKTCGRFSKRSFLFRRGETVVGVYWPWLWYRRGAPSGELEFCHVFGKVDEAQRAVNELICVDAQGGVWRFGDVAASFAINGELPQEHDRSHLPESPNDWLRYDVHAIQQVLSGGPIPAPQRVE